ncbi:MAG: proline racemase family protein [Clostridiales bacterium]|nr:proline racemase family protein [Clostridiales bacterium]
MLRFTNMITAVDAHTGGEPLRIITAGLPPILGADILDKRIYLKQNLDHLRKLLMLEPRGHSGMYGCIVTPATTKDGDFGVIFTHNEGYSSMCGHGIIAVTKALIEIGQIPASEGINTVRIDAPAGRVTAMALVEEGLVKQVEFENVPSFVYATDVSVRLSGLGEIKVDIAYGGAFYVYADADRLDLTVDPNHMEELVKRGMEIKHAVMEAMKVEHPLEPRIVGIYGTIFTAPLKPREFGLHSKNVCIFAEGQIDRSPTGTGTAGRVALLHHKGLFNEGMTLQNDSIIDTVMTGRIAGLTKVANFPAVIPVVGGTAYIMGFNQLVLEPEDPLPTGFRITGG